MDGLNQSEQKGGDQEMFGKWCRQKAREQEVYEQILHNAGNGLPDTQRHPLIRRSAARQAREQTAQEQQVAQEQARQKQHARVTRALFQQAEQRQKVQATAYQHLREIARGLHHDGIEPDEALMQRLAQVATDAYVESKRWDRWERPDPEQVQEVFETEYQEALKTRTFFNPLTGEIEAW